MRTEMIFLDWVRRARVVGCWNMLKIKKGIKKKIKGKKDKEDDLFDPENLAKYKKELEESRREGGESSSAGPEPSTNQEEDDEWKKFKQLTAGIDVTLKKTSGDLDRIKTTSFFQKKTSTAVVEEKKEQWEDVEKESPELSTEPDPFFVKSEDTQDSSWGPPQVSKIYEISQ